MIVTARGVRVLSSLSSSQSAIVIDTVSRLSTAPETLRCERLMPGLWRTTIHFEDGTDITVTFGRRDNEPVIVSGSIIPHEMESRP